MRRDSRFVSSLGTAVVVLAVAAPIAGSMAGCGGLDEGPAGPPGPMGPAGTPGTPGNPGPADVGELQLPGDRFYPESLHAGADGSLYVGSIGYGQIVKFAPGSAKPVVLVDTNANLKNVAGVLVDDAGGKLWACSNDSFGGTPASLRSFKLSDGSALARYSDAKLKGCNDLAFDGQHNLYVTDPSAGLVFKLAASGTALAEWSSDPALTPLAAMGVGVDGIAFDGQNALYVNNFDRKSLLRIAIKTDGSADVPVAIAITPGFLNGPDGMRALGAGSLVAVENNAFAPTTPGQLVRIDITGTTATKTVISNRLDGPTSVVKVGQTYWVTEGQLGALFTAMPMPKLPFLVRRFTL